MPFGGLLSLAGPALSIGSGLAGIFGGTPADNVQMPKGYQFGNMAGADQGAFGGIGNLAQYNVPGQLLPQYQNIAQSMVNSPYGGQFQHGAAGAGDMSMGAGQGAYAAGGQQMGQAVSMLPDVNALLTLGFDPQNALYARTAQRMQDQVRAGEGARGIAMTPYGAGVENQAMSNFNIDWENNALQRAMQGASGAGGLLSNIGQNMAGGNQLQAAGAGQYLSGAGTPYNTFQGINANALNTLGQTGAFGQSASVLPQQQIQDYLSYMSGGVAQQGANNQTAQLGLNQAGMSFNQNQALGGNIGSGLAGLSRAYQGWGSPAGGANPWGGSFGSSSGLGMGMSGLY